MGKKEIKFSKTSLSQLLLSKKQQGDKQDKEILEMFGKIEVDVPLLELIKKVPKYAKFLNDLRLS